MSKEEKTILIKDFLVWAEYNRSAQLNYMHNWLGDMDQEKLIEDFIEEEL